MVVLTFKHYLCLAVILPLFWVGCTKDRLIDIAPIEYPVEYWKKDSLVYRLLEGDEVVTQQSTAFGVSSPDTLTLFLKTIALYKHILKKIKMAELSIPFLVFLILVLTPCICILLIQQFIRLLSNKTL